VGPAALAFTAGFRHPAERLYKPAIQGVIMGKDRNAKKETKKAPAKTMKEKKEAKKAKKAAR
jgi:hypothetical protein